MSMLYHRGENHLPMLRTITTKVNLGRPTWVSADTLNVATEWLGAPLASPLRRLWAIGVDLLVVGVLSGLDAFWLGAAVVVFLFQMRSREHVKPWLRKAWLIGACALCLWLAVEQGWQAWSVRHDAPSGVSETSSVTPAKPVLSDAERIAVLEEELAQARKPQDFSWQLQLRTWWNGLGVGFGWAIVYFSLVPAWLRGQSLGKKLFGLRVVQLTGKPLTVPICFSRYGGYVAGMATGMFGFAQILWDANRQSIQDKVAHTVVLDLHAPFHPLQAQTLPAIAPDSEKTDISSQIVL